MCADNGPSTNLNDSQAEAVAVEALTIETVGPSPRREKEVLPVLVWKEQFPRSGFLRIECVGLFFGKSHLKTADLRAARVPRVFC